MDMHISPPAHLPAPAATAPADRPRRTWPAILVLYLLSPLVAELLTGSTPPLAWNNVGGIIATVGLYGSGALLAREIIRRRRLGWSNLLLLGIAYGALEEGVAYQSWFNPRWIQPPDAARLFDVNWTFVVAFTTIHMVLSISVAIIVVEAIFPSLAARPWLGRKGFVALTVWLGAVVALLGFTYGFLNFHGKGYDHPPVSYILAPALFIHFLALGALVRFPPARSIVMSRPAPRLWTLRIAAFLGGFAVLGNLFVLRAILPLPLVPIALIVLVDLLGVLAVSHWAQRPGWGMRHRLALASGVLGCFIILSPFFEFVLPNRDMRGLTLANLLALSGLIWLARWVDHVEAAGQASPQPEQESLPPVVTTTG
jgi:hypothetical protein